MKHIPPLPFPPPPFVPYRLLMLILLGLVAAAAAEVVVPAGPAPKQTAKMAPITKQIMHIITTKQPFSSSELEAFFSHVSLTSLSWRY